MWKCKKCGGSNFKIIEVETTEKIGVIFDKNGVEDECEKIEVVDRYERLECSNCGNYGSIFNLIEEIADYVKQQQDVIINGKSYKCDLGNYDSQK